MRSLTIDGAAGGETKSRHDVTFPLLTLHRGKDRVHFSTGFFQKENIVCCGCVCGERVRGRPPGLPDIFPKEDKHFAQDSRNTMQSLLCSTE
jgi:hypothetical protein